MEDINKKQAKIAKSVLLKDKSLQGKKGDGDELTHFRLINSYGVINTCEVVSPMAQPWQKGWITTRQTRMPVSAVSELKIQRCLERVLFQERSHLRGRGKCVSGRGN